MDGPGRTPKLLVLDDPDAFAELYRPDTLARSSPGRVSGWVTMAPI